MNLDADVKTLRNSITVDTSRSRVAKGTAAGKLGAAAAGRLDAAIFVDVSQLRVQLDSVHAQIRGTVDATRLADLLDQYVVLVAKIASAQPVAAPYIPGGSVLQAAVRGLG